MLSRILTVGLIAGLLTGLAITVVQMLWSTPIILEAETYEGMAAPAVAGTLQDGTAQPSPAAHATSHSTSHDGHDHDHGHSHGDGSAWAPADGFERMLWTGISNMLLGVGGGLVLAGLMALRTRPVDAKVGLGFGLAVFASLSFAPALGLPPELPGMEAAALEGRQAWWIVTVAATGAAIALAVYARPAWLKACAIPLAALPHLIGAPQPEIHATAVPPELIQEFFAASLVTSAIFWGGLGGLVGTFAKRLGIGARRARAA